MVAPDDNLVHMHKYKYKYINTNVYTYRYIQTCSDSDMVSSNNNQVHPVGNISFSLSTDISVLTPSPVETQV